MRTPVWDLRLFISLFIRKCYHLVSRFLGFPIAMTFDPFLLIGVAAFTAVILWFVLGRKQETPEQPAQTQRQCTTGDKYPCYW